MHETRPLVFLIARPSIDPEAMAGYLREVGGESWLERRLEEKGETWEWAEILRGLDNLQEVEAVFQGKHFILRSQVQGQAHKAFKV